MGKYFDTFSQAMGVNAEKTNSMDRYKKQSEIPGTPVVAPDAVKSSSYYPFNEEFAMEDLEDAGDEEGNQTNMDVGATTGNQIDENEDHQLKLKLEALAKLR